MTTVWRNTTLYAGFSKAKLADAASVTVEVGGSAPFELGTTIAIVPKLNGERMSMALSVNGIPGGNATFGTIDEQTGEFRAPLVMPPGGGVTLTATTKSEPKRSRTIALTFKSARLPPCPPSTVAASSTTASAPTDTATCAPGTARPTDPAQAAAAHLLAQATFGPTCTEIARVRHLGRDAWLQEQFSRPASPVPAGDDPVVARRDWYLNMTHGEDQLRQRMMFALWQIFIGPADKNPCDNAIQPWLAALSNNAFGNYKTLLREITLHATSKCLDDGSGARPLAFERCARHVMQSFTVGPVLLHHDGTVRQDRNAAPISTDDPVLVDELAKALSGARHSGDDLDAVLDTLFKHPNVPPFVATRLIRHFVTGTPSPAYVRRVTEAFAFGAGGCGERGDLKATLLAVFTDPEARYDGRTPNNGHMKDPILHTLSLVRALDGVPADLDNQVPDVCLAGQEPANAPGVFS